MAILQVERVGGLAGFGGGAARIRSRGQIDTATLSAADQKAVDALFAAPASIARPAVADGFRYKLTRPTAHGPETVVAAEAAVPAKVAGCVTDEFV